MIPPRSLPGGLPPPPSAPPVNTYTDESRPSNTLAQSTNTMGNPSNNGGIVNFTKTTILPILIALLLYLFLFQFLVPLYRKHRARYSQYLPLSNANTTSRLTSRLPTSLTGSVRTLRDRFLHFFYTASFNPQGPRRTSTSSTHSSNILTDESGEAMVGFDYSNTTGSVEDQNRRRRDAMERQVARGLQAAREMGMGGGEQDLSQSIPPERRLSRELEEVFRDDSDDEEGEEGPNAVTSGRRSMSRSQ